MSNWTAFFLKKFNEISKGIISHSRPDDWISPILASKNTKKSRNFLPTFYLTLKILYFIQIKKLKKFRVSNKINFKKMCDNKHVFHKLHFLMVGVRFQKSKSTPIKKIEFSKSENSTTFFYCLLFLNIYSWSVIGHF